MRAITTKILSAVLAVMMVAGAVPAYAFDVLAAPTTSAPILISPAPTWSSEAMQAAVQNGLLHGDENGNLDPQGNLTRAQAAAVLVRALGRSKQADLSVFTDVNEGDWYYEEVSYAVFMGLFEGKGDGCFDPNGYITREEMCVVLARALKLNEANKAIYAAFSDADVVSTWAEGAVAACISAGYIQGSDGYILPTNPITREQFATVMDRIAKKYYTEPGIYRGGEGSVIINSPNVSLGNARIRGDVIIGDGVGDGDIELFCIDIEGRLIIRGGGVNTVKLEDSTVQEVILTKPEGNVRLLSDEKSEIKEITVEEGKEQVIISAPAEKITVKGTDTEVKIKDAVIEQIEIKAPNTKIALEDATIETIKVEQEATNIEIDNKEGSTIKTIETQSQEVTLKGEGQITEIKGDGEVKDENGQAPELTGCNHVWGDWTQGDTGHSRTCTLCQETESQQHYGIWASVSETEHSRTCVVCGDTKTEAHKAVTDAGYAAQCGVAGLTDGSHCEICDYVITAQTVIPALQHDFSGEVSYTAEGHYMTCQHGCGAKDTIVAHTFEEGASCDKALKCFGCDYTKPAGQHSYGEWTPAEDTTKHISTCAACGDTKTEAHKAVTDVGYAAQCGVAGLTDGSHCEICNYVITAQSVIPALQHDFSGEVSYTAEGHYLTCQHGCGAKDTIVAHTFEEGASCDKALKCFGCDYTKPAGQHSYGEWTPAEDTTKHISTCAACGDTKTEAHKAVTDAGYAAQCGVAGLTDGSHCEICNYVITAQTVIPALTHTYGEWKSDATGHWKECTLCGDDTPTAGHEMPEGIKCDEESACTVCGFTKAAGEHTWGNWAPHAQYIFLHTRTCSVCAETEDAQHGMENLVVQDKNETTHKIACALCGTTEVSEHYYTQPPVITKPATPTEDGIKTYTCDGCGYEKHESITYKAVTVEDMAIVNDGGVVYYGIAVSYESKDGTLPGGFVFRAYQDAKDGLQYTETGYIRQDFYYLENGDEYAVGFIPVDKFLEGVQYNTVVIEAIDDPGKGDNATVLASWSGNLVVGRKAAELPTLTKAVTDGFHQIYIEFASDPGVVEASFFDADYNFLGSRYINKQSMVVMGTLQCYGAKYMKLMNYEGEVEFDGTTIKFDIEEYDDSYIELGSYDKTIPAIGDVTLNPDGTGYFGFANPEKINPDVNYFYRIYAMDKDGKWTSVEGSAFRGNAENVYEFDLLNTFEGEEFSYDKLAIVVSPWDDEEKTTTGSSFKEINVGFEATIGGAIDGNVKIETTPAVDNGFKSRISNLIPGKYYRIFYSDTGSMDDIYGYDYIISAEATEDDNWYTDDNVNHLIGRKFLAFIGNVTFKDGKYSIVYNPVGTWKDVEVVDAIKDRKVVIEAMAVGAEIDGRLGIALTYQGEEGVVPGGFVFRAYQDTKDGLQYTEKGYVHWPIEYVEDDYSIGFIPLERFLEDVQYNTVVIEAVDDLSKGDSATVLASWRGNLVVERGEAKLPTITKAVTDGIYQVYVETEGDPGVVEATFYDADYKELGSSYINRQSTVIQTISYYGAKYMTLANYEGDVEFDDTGIRFYIEEGSGEYIELGSYETTMPAIGTVTLEPDGTGYFSFVDPDASTLYENYWYSVYAMDEAGDWCQVGSTVVWGDTGNVYEFSLLDCFDVEDISYDKLAIIVAARDTEVAKTMGVSYKELNVGVEASIGDAIEGNIKIQTTPVVDDELVIRVSNLTPGNVYKIFYSDTGSLADVDDYSMFKATATKEDDSWYPENNVNPYADYKYLACVATVTFENGKYTIVYNPIGTWQDVELVETLPTELPAPGNLRLDANAKALVWDKPNNMMGIKTFNVYFSKDNGKTWELAGNGYDKLYLNKIFLPTGTYNKIKIESIGRTPGTYIPGEYVEDFVLVMNVTEKTGVSTTFVPLGTIGSHLGGPEYLTVLNTGLPNTRIQYHWSTTNNGSGSNGYSVSSSNANGLFASVTELREGCDYYLVRTEEDIKLGDENTSYDVNIAYTQFSDWTKFEASGEAEANNAVFAEVKLEIATFPKLSYTAAEGYEFAYYVVQFSKDGGKTWMGANSVSNLAFANLTSYDFDGVYNKLRIYAITADGKVYTYLNDINLTVDLSINEEVKPTYSTDANGNLVLTFGGFSEKDSIFYKYSMYDADNRQMKGGTGSTQGVGAIALSISGSDKRQLKGGSVLLTVNTRQVANGLTMTIEQEKFYAPVDEPVTPSDPTEE